MIILGISYGYHCSAVAVIRDGVLIAFASEERFSYKKNDAGYPAQAIPQVLRTAGITLEDVDKVVYYEDAVLKADRVVYNSTKYFEDPKEYLKGVVTRWHERGVLNPLGHIARSLRIDESKLTYVSHHFAHAALAYYTSPFDRALVVTMDGVGEYETMTVWKGEGQKLEPLQQMNIPDSLGLLYGAITKFCGFEINEGEYKLMGLAAFGEPTHTDLISSWVELNSSTLKASTDWLRVAAPNDDPIAPEFFEIFGMPFVKGQDDHLNPRFANLAASLQHVFEQKISKFIADLIAEHGIDAVCLGGGVALNCNVNGLLRRTVTPKVFIPPDPGDAGSAYGAALGWWHENQPASPAAPSMLNAYHGTTVDESYLWEGGRGFASLINVETVPEDEVPARLASLLAQGQVYGHMYGRFEMGPRALGNRSILADPRTAEMKERINISIKHREPFRPFAPAVLEQHAHHYFDIPSRDGLGELAPEYFMLCTHFATELGRKTVPAAVHNDGTSRVQIVSETSNPRFAAILTAFEAETGVPVLVNTSLNVNGQPMASSSKSGLFTLLNSEIDGLVIGNSFVTRRD